MRQTEHEKMTPLELAMEREGQIDYCDECEYIRVVDGTPYCGISGKLLPPLMFMRGQGSGPARRCRKRKGAMDMGLTGADLARLGPAAQKQVLEKLGMMGKPKTGVPARPAVRGEDEQRSGADAAHQTQGGGAERSLRGRKYHNEPDTRGSLRFDSKKEARRYDELVLMQKAGKIRKLRLQAQYTLQESFITPEGERVRAIKYVADFAYERATEPDKYGTVVWLPEVEDVKSKATKTAQYELKKKLMREKFNITITEV